MTCSACVGTITGLLQQLSFVQKPDINLLSNSGSIVFTGKDNVGKITQTIEDAGFDVTLDSLADLSR